MRVFQGSALSVANDLTSDLSTLFFCGRVGGPAVRAERDVSLQAGRDGGEVRPLRPQPLRLRSGRMQVRFLSNNADARGAQVLQAGPVERTVRRRTDRTVAWKSSVPSPQDERTGWKLARSHLNLSTVFLF